MIKYYFTLLISIFFIQSAYSQAIARDLQGNNSFDIRENTDVDGSPYLFEDWVKGDLIDINGNKIEDVMLNYDGEKSRFVSKQEGNKVLELNIWNYRAVELMVEGKLDTYVNITNKGEAAYCKVIYESDYVACYQKFSATKKRSSNSGYGQVKSMYKYSNKNETFLYYNDELIKIKRKEKDISKLLKRKDLKSYTKENKLNLNKDKDLAKLLEYASK